MVNRFKSISHCIGLRFRGRHDMMEALRYGTSMNLRLLLAIAAALYCVLIIAHPRYAWQDPSYIVDSTIASMGPWAAMFALDAFCLMWRILDSTPRKWWAWGVNIYTFSLWFSMVGVTTSYLGYLSAGSTGEIILCLISAWVTFRVNTTHTEKETA